MRAMIVILVVALGRLAAAEPIDVKVATLIPQGSAWGKVLEDAGREVERATDGRVRLRFYWSGQLGDERDFVRKMRLGGIDGATLATTGLSLVADDTLVLQLPFLFRSLAELDRVWGAISDDLAADMEASGYLLLAWADVGWVRLYTTRPLVSIDDLRRARLWLWPDEPFLRALLGGVGVKGVPLGLAEVYPALLTGGIDGCYGPALAAIGMSWYTRTRYATEQPISYSVAALVLRKATWDRLAPEDRLALQVIGRQAERELRAVARRDEARARRALAAAGVRFLPLSPEALDLLEREGRALRQRFAGELYPRALLGRVERLLDVGRAEIRGGAARP